MSRRPVFWYPGLHYHVTQRGHSGDPIFRDDADRLEFLALLGTAALRFGWEVRAYCLMDNHVHLFLGTSGPTLSAGMRWLTGNYAIRFNRRRHRVGSPYQGRYHAFTVESERHFYEVTRYVVLNPVRARIVSRPEDWPWSSHRAVLGLIPAPKWLAVERSLEDFEGLTDRYREYVEAGMNFPTMNWRGVGRRC